ncbi:MAG: acyl-CoA dehydrogenase family protein, partial [Acidimicrobiales bacterium]
MDFTFTEEQDAVAEAAAGVFGGMADPDRVAEVERSTDRVDEALWSALAEANLLGLAVPEEHGGSGLGMTELCLVLEQQGRHVAPVPLWATTVLGALPVARFGTPEQRAGLLPGVVAGQIRLSAALADLAAA